VIYSFHAFHPAYNKLAVQFAPPPSCQEEFSGPKPENCLFGFQGAGGQNDLSLFTKEKFNHVCAEILFFHQLFQLFEDLSGFSADVGRMHAVFFGEFFAGNMLKEVHTDEFGIVRVE